MSTSNLAGRSEADLGREFGPEFSYYQEALRRPDGLVLLKLGGLIVDYNMESVAASVRTLFDLDVPVAIVHGAGPQIDAQLAKHGVESKKIGGIRVTDEVVLDVVESSLLEVNSTVSRALEEAGVAVKRLTDVFKADFKDRETYGFVGDVVEALDDPVRSAIKVGFVPVVSCLGGSLDGSHALNVNGDTASTALAVKLAVHKYMTLTAEGGIRDANGNIIPVITTRDGQSEMVDRLLEEGTIYGGMVPKVHEVLAAVEQLPETSSAVITHPDSLIRELFTHAGEGTLVRKGDKIIRHPSVDAFNRQRLQSLIEDSFNGRLDGDYFEKLPNNAEVYVTAQLYNGAAIVIPGEYEDSPAYLDKIAVPAAGQGVGVGQELLDAAIQRYQGGLFWRTRSTNEGQIRLYSRIADTKTTAGEWVVFTAGVAAEVQEASVQYAASRPQTITY